MKKILGTAACIFFAGLIFFPSCKKETSCEGCVNGNKPPTAIAGPDQVTALPTDSISLDGRSSNDPDGTISEWLWTKISGPASFIINNSSASNSVVKNLVKGVYQFELKVTDNGGLSAKDTMQVIVNDPSQPNRPPIANAGIDQTITLPLNSITLDGNGSTDPDNDINSYHWTKISGPLSFSIPNANAVQTPVSNLIGGIYQFELKVTDAGGLFSKDTVKVIVNEDVIVDCNGNVRSQVDAQLIPVNTLSIARKGIAIATAGNKILFAGGHASSIPQVYSRVDIFDISNNSWTIAELSQARSYIGVAVLNNKIFFAGGLLGNGFSSRVDIYDAVTNNWTTAELSQAMYLLAGAAVGNKVLFASGFPVMNSAPPVDILDVTTNTWSVDSLRNRPTQSISDAGIAVTAIDNKIYFAGNACDWMVFDHGSITSTINIYDVTAGTWSNSDLSIARGVMASIAVGKKNYWAGGAIDQQNLTDLVEIWDANTGLSTFACLFQPNALFSAVLKENKIVFFTSGVETPVHPVRDKFDIYHIGTNTWSVGVLPANIYSSSIISVNNVIYVAGGYVNGVLSNQVWKLEF